jgi:hypothetical protein
MKAAAGLKRKTVTLAIPLGGTDAAGGNFIKEFVYSVSFQSKHLFSINDRTRCKDHGPNTVRTFFTTMTRDSASIVAFTADRWIRT